MKLYKVGRLDRKISFQFKTDESLNRSWKGGGKKVIVTNQLVNKILNRLVDGETNCCSPNATFSPVNFHSQKYCPHPISYFFSPFKSFFHSHTLTWWLWVTLSAQATFYAFPNPLIEWCCNRTYPNPAELILMIIWAADAIACAC